MTRSTFNDEQHPGRWLLIASLAFLLLAAFVLVALGILMPISFERALASPKVIREPMMLIANIQDLVHLVGDRLAAR